MSVYEDNKEEDLNGKMKVSDLKKVAIDILAYKRVREIFLLKELVRDMSNVKSNESFDE